MFGRRTTPDAPPAGNGQPNPARAKGQGHAQEEGADDVVALWSPGKTSARKSVEALLLERGHITEDQIEQAKNVANQTPGKTLTQILLGMSAASEAQILSALAETLNV